MTLLAVTGAELAFGMTPLLDQAALSIAAGERIGLIGRNGSGKTSLLGAIAGRLALDDGQIRARDGLRIVTVEQEPELGVASSLRMALVARGGLGELHDERERWRVEARLIERLHRVGLSERLDPSRLSGGERKRAVLALAFALEPDLLLLDEPTNHLDIEGIEHLESLLIEEQRGSRAAIVITHDRRFLDRIATRIVELDRGVLGSYPGNFAAYEARRADELASEDLARRRFDRFWAQEEAWIRKGVEARRTRNAGRVARLESLRRKRAERRNRLGEIRVQIDAGERSGRLVAELQDVSKRFGERTVVDRLSLRLMRGDRLALIGPNGAGKTTLARLLLGTLEPDSGTVRLGTNLKVAYFDQLREQLDPDRTLAQTIAPGSDWVEIAGARKHVTGYLADFLFSPQRAQAPVRTLSGGERNRLLLARLFARPSNLLVLDEPTNDLDIESLELLEASLAEYAGTLILVSHDRAFLDNVVTQSWVAEGDGVWKEYAGGYTDWLAQRPVRRPGPDRAAAEPAADAVAPSKSSKPAQARLSYKERRDLEALPARIESLEKEQNALQASMAAGDYHRRGRAQIQQDRARLEQIEIELARSFARWSELEARDAIDGRGRALR
jgi:ABC transport system ATP-binding/permease protein